MSSQCTVHRNKNAGGWMSVCVFEEQLNGHSSLTHSLTHSTTILLSLSLGYLFVHKHNNARFGGWNWYLVVNSLLILSLFLEEGSNCLEDDSIARCEWKGWTGLNGATRQGQFSPTTTRLLSGVEGNSTRRIQKKTGTGEQKRENKVIPSHEERRSILSIAIAQQTFSWCDSRAQWQKVKGQLVPFLLDWWVWLMIMIKALPCIPYLNLRFSHFVSPSPLYFTLVTPHSGFFRSFRSEVPSYCSIGKDDADKGSDKVDHCLPGPHFLNNEVGMHRVPICAIFWLR